MGHVHGAKETHTSLQSGLSVLMKFKNYFMFNSLMLFGIDEREINPPVQRLIYSAIVLE